MSYFSLRHITDLKIRSEQFWCNLNKHVAHKLQKCPIQYQSKSIKRATVLLPAPFASLYRLSNFDITFQFWENTDWRRWCAIFRVSLMLKMPYKNNLTAILPHPKIEPGNCEWSQIVAKDPNALGPGVEFRYRRLFCSCGSFPAFFTLKAYGPGRAVTTGGLLMRAPCRNDDI